MGFTKQQEEAIKDMRPLVCVSAGAGSGKTTILIERIVYLLSHPECWPDRQPALDRIVAITFTDKAASEMKARLRKRFREAQAGGMTPGAPDWRDLERQVDGARVSTIHAFCAAILREHALRIGMDPEWAVLGDADAEQLMEQAVVETLQELLEQDDPAVTRLSVEWGRKQLKAALAEMVGKRWEVQAGEDATRYSNPESLYTFWLEQWPTAQESFLHVCRHSRELPFLLENLRAFEGCCLDPEDKREKQRESCVAVLTAIHEGRDHLCERVRGYLDAFPRISGSKKKWPEGDFEQVRDTLNIAKKFLTDKCLFPDWDPEQERIAARVTCDFFQVGARVITAYREARQAWNSLDYEDMINETLEVLQKNPVMRERVASGISFLLIDEFQDTDGRQYDIARMLANVENGPRLFYVGDVKQSIYYFRGAEVDLFNSVIRNAPHPLELLDNFRSQPGVLKFINDFFAQSHLLEAVETYRPMGVFRESLGLPCVECFLPEDPGKLNMAEMHEQDARYVVGRILELCKANSPLRVMDMETKSPRPATFDDIVLLFRRGSYMDTYESALREKNIPYTRVAGAGFFQRREVQDILALLKLVLDPWDEEALLTVLRSPLAGLSDESLMRMAMMEGLAPVFHSNRIPEHFDQPEMLEEARRLFSDLYDRREGEPGNFLRLVLEHTNYEAILLGGHLGLQRTANLRKVIQLADNFGQSRPATLHEFARYLDDVTYRELKEGESPLQSRGMGAVTLMTIHKAKGLEYPIVFLPEMFAEENKGGKDIFYQRKNIGLASKIPNDEGPSQRGAFAELMKRYKAHEEMMENARILYVAMTRARDYLVLCGHASAKPNTWSGVLNRVYALGDQSHDDVIQGDDWRMLVKRHPPICTPLQNALEPAVLPDAEELARQIAPLEQQQAGSRVFSVTHLLSHMAGTEDLDSEYESEEEFTVERESSIAGVSERALAMARGSLVHKLFECWDFTTNRAPDIRMLVKEAGLGISQFDTLSGALRGAVERFQASELWALYTNARRIEREVPFLLDIDPMMIRGVVDAVVDDDLIVDYKTGMPGSSLESHYETQLCLYAAALRALKGTLPKQGILWYADHGQAHTLVFTEERIVAALARAREFCATF